MVEICFLASKYFAENISVIRSMCMSKKHSFSSLLSRCNVHLKLGTNSVEVILVHFTIFSIFRVFLFHFEISIYSSICRQKVSLLDRVRYRKIQLAAACSQADRRKG